MSKRTMRAYLALGPEETCARSLRLAYGAGALRVARRLRAEVTVWKDARGRECSADDVIRLLERNA